MPESTYHQHSFLGGEWSPQAQARIDNPAYKTALNVCVNFIPTAQGAAMRRSGTQTLGPTFNRGQAVVRRFQSNAAIPYQMEFTAGQLQFWYGTGVVCTNDRRTVTASSSSSGTLSLTLDASSGWSAGDRVILWAPTTVTADSFGPYKNRVFQVITAVTNTLTLHDDKGTALGFDSAANQLVNCRVLRILRFATNYSDATKLQYIRSVQAQTNAIILSSQDQPQVVTVTVDQSGETDPTITFAAAAFVDGPYLDAVADTGTVSGYSGTITVTSAAQTFVASDATYSRHIRLFTQPAAWSSGTAYSNGNYVTDTAGAWWVFTYSSALTGVIPGTTTVVNNVVISPWEPSLTAGQWAWGKITGFTNSTTVTVALQTALNSTNGTTLTQSRLGLYTTGSWPTCGCYHKGRLWLLGATPNRIDGSNSNALLTFSPTDSFGNVLDSNSVSYTLNSKDLNSFYWAVPDAQGILAGALGGKWLFTASSINDPITPRSFDVNHLTSEGAAQVEPYRVNMALVDVRRYGRTVEEYLDDAFSQRFSGRPLNEFAKHLFSSGAIEIAYQAETVPVVWVVMTDGTAAGCTYRRVSRFITANPEFEAWSRLSISNGDVTVASACAAPAVNALSEYLYLVVKDSNADYYVEALRPHFEAV